MSESRMVSRTIVASGSGSGPSLHLDDHQPELAERASGGGDARGQHGPQEGLAEQPGHGVGDEGFGHGGRWAPDSGDGSRPVMMPPRDGVG